MKPIERILFPVGLTENSEKMVPLVIDIVQKFNATLDVLFVARVFQYFTSIYVPHPSIDLFEGELIDGANKKMNEFTTTYFESLNKVNGIVILGDPAESILSYTTEHGIDMIVMGTHGRKGLDRVIFGSVAERVIKNSPVPVLTIALTRQSNCCALCIVHCALCTVRICTLWEQPKPAFLESRRPDSNPCPLSLTATNHFTSGVCNRNAGIFHTGVFDYIE